MHSRALPASLLALALALPPAGPARAAGTVPEEDEAAPPAAEPVRRTSFTYQVSYANIAKSTREFDLWVPLPARDGAQEISDLVVQAPGGSTEMDEEHGNNVFHGHSGPRGGVPYNVNIQFVAERREVRNDTLDHKPPTPPEPPDDLSIYTEPETHLQLTRKVRSLSKKITGRHETAPLKARAIYEWVIENIDLSRGGNDSWGQGDLKATLAAKHGNSLDVASVFVGLARASEIPARTVIGFKLPERAVTGTLSGYHAWAEFWAPGWGWVPVDPALAMERPSRRPYYFGNLDQDRIRISTGRDVTLKPPQKGEPLNFLLYPYAEADGEPLGGSAYRFSFQPAPQPPETAPAAAGP